MNTNAFDAKAAIAILVILGCFTIIGIYVFRNQMPDGFVIAIVSGAISGILSFYFGHANGTTTALAGAATTLANNATAQVAQQQAQVSQAAITQAAHEAAIQPVVPPA